MPATGLSGRRAAGNDAMLFRRTKPTITRDQALGARPRRMVQGDLLARDDGGAALKVPLRPTRVGRWIFRVPDGATKTFEFDSIGLFVWNLCDGKNSVQQIIRKLAREYRLNLREAEVPTLQFLQTLAKKGLVAMTLEQKR